MCFPYFKRASLVILISLLDLVFLYSQNSIAQDLTAAKSAYGAFERTPEDLLRPMEADRPDITESGRTVDAGWYQVEMSFIEWAKDGQLEQSVRVPSTNFKLGLSSRSDLQLIVNGIDWDKTEEAAAYTYLQDSRVRWKYNLVGNDAGDLALGVLSTILIPSGPGSSESYQPEGGIALPYSYEVSPIIELMGQTEFQFSRRRSDTDYGTDYLQTLGLGYPIYGPVSGYFEQVFLRSLDQGAEAQHISSFGFVFEVSCHLTVDLGAQLGVSASAPDQLIFSGLTHRF